jgi:acyl-CoA oxidase
MKGVTIVDMGMKMGLNGVDNGALFFDKVRVPRENLMNRYSDVDEKGNFTSETQNIPSRFFEVVGSKVRSWFGLFSENGNIIRPSSNQAVDLFSGLKHPIRLCLLI